MKRIICFALALLSLISLVGCEKTDHKEKFTDYSFDYFDTVTTIVGFEDSKEEFDANCVEIKALLWEYHKLYTIYNSYEGINNLCVINRTKDGVHAELEVDNRIIDMLLYAKEMYLETDGKLNVAMGSVLSIWHRYREDGMDDPESAELPPMDALEAAAEHMDIDDVVIDRTKGTVYLSDPQLKLDVGAIAKGYAVEEVATWMAEKGMDGYTLNVGGNIRIVGKRPDGEKWKVGIENPDTSNEDVPYIEYLMLEDMSIVTSGTYQRYYTVDGKRYHHIIDPATLMPGENFMSVSVVCKSSAMADAFSTALFSMSYEDGKALVEKTEGLEAMWVMPDGEQRYSDGFKAYCAE